MDHSASMCEQRLRGPSGCHRRLHRLSDMLTEEEEQWPHRWTTCWCACRAIKTHDDKEQQRLEAWGRHNERYGGTTGKHAVPRVQSYGFTNHAPKGSQGVTLNLGGNPDNAMMIGMEHPKYRPKNLEEGEFKLYEKWGGYDHAQENEVDSEGGQRHHRMLPRRQSAHQPFGRVVICR